MSPPLAATPEAASASWLAWTALSAFWRTVAVNCSIVAAVSSSELACCSVRDDRSRLPAAISLEATAIERVPSCTSETTLYSESFIVFSARIRSPISSRATAPKVVLRSPLATVSASATAACKGRVILRVISHAHKAPIVTTSTPSVSSRLKARAFAASRASAVSSIALRCMASSAFSLAE